MKESERIKQYESLNNVLTEKNIDIIKRHNIICNIIDNGDFEKVMELNNKQIVL